ncbi:MAG TPA: ribonuclease HII [Chthoniobacterales bacterium]
MQRKESRFVESTVKFTGVQKSMRCSLRHENLLRQNGWHSVAGIDEAGRGPLAGPVVAAAVILPEGFRHARLTDSKQLTPNARDEIFVEITANTAIQWSVASVEPVDIDRLNILRATHQAMRLAIAGLTTAPAHVLIDGLPVQPFPIPQTALVRGDALSFSIAAASVVAKVTRDQIMRQCHAEYPDYGFDQHKGYATPQHLAMLRRHGPCPIHRRSFAPVAEQWLF